MRKHQIALAITAVWAAFGTFLLYQYILDQQRLSWRDYLKVQDGMTQAQIEAELGPPRRVDIRPSGGKEVRWIGRNEGMVYVEFDENGRMVHKHFIESARDYSLSFFPRPRD
jgi:hypothetical protein